jgi:TolA-binding protein
MTDDSREEHMIRRHAVLAAFIVAALSHFIAAEPRWTLESWLKELQTRIHRVENRRQSQTVAVAAVRGSKAEGPAARQLYWKGREKSAAVSQAQLDAFKAAVALAEAGKKDDAQKSLTDFLAAYPQSPMKAEAEKTLALLGTAEETP